ncbi:hypothetical protein [Nocardioides dongkuii]|uniref:hypothetical protein n=1 Tax=Nocardioides dongkuii TaxID=2760089 RepID=UPI00187792A7|nr:hypothetical protein [Nocardioides dongkuii]
MRTAPSLAALALLGAVTLAGCGDDADAGEAPTWSAADTVLDASGLVWESGGTVHLGDGTTIETGEEVAGYVVAGDGVYLVAAAGSDATAGPVLHATPEDPGNPEDTGAVAAPDSLRVSPDGRYLAFLDPETGTQDEYGTPLGTAVVVDLVEGEEVVRSAAAMGDPGQDDLADLYEDAGAPEVLGLTDRAAYVAGPGAVLAYDLATGEPSEVAPSAADAWDDDWFLALSSPEARTSPGGAWTLAQPADGSPARLVPADGGKPVVTRAPYDVYELDSWLDDQTAVGGALDGQTDVLLGCTLPTGRCAPLPDVPAGARLPADRSGPRFPTVRP